MKLKKGKTYYNTVNDFIYIADEAFGINTITIVDTIGSCDQRSEFL